VSIHHDGPRPRWCAGRVIRCVINNIGGSQRWLIIVTASWQYYDLKWVTWPCHDLFRVLYYPCRLVLDISYIYTKFDDFNFSHTRDIIGAYQNFNGLRDSVTPLWGMICHPRARTCYDQPAYRIWSVYLHPLRCYERRYKMSKMGWFVVVRITQGDWK